MQRQEYCHQNNCQTFAVVAAQIAWELKTVKLVSLPQKLWIVNEKKKPTNCIRIEAWTRKSRFNLDRLVAIVRNSVCIRWVFVFFFLFRSLLFVHSNIYLNIYIKRWNSASFICGRCSPFGRKVIGRRSCRDNELKPKQMQKSPPYHITLLIDCPIVWNGSLFLSVRLHSIQCLERCYWMTASVWLLMLQFYFRVFFNFCASFSSFVYPFNVCVCVPQLIYSKMMVFFGAKCLLNDLIINSACWFGLEERSKECYNSNPFIMTWMVLVLVIEATVTCRAIAIWAILPTINI